jgi:hypothetical protein
LKRLAVPLSFSQHDTYRGSSDITTATSENGHSVLAIWSYAASKMSPAYTSSTGDGKDRGLINYNTPRAKTSQILGMFRTCASFTHKDDVQGQPFSERLDFFLPNSIWRLCDIEFGM